MVRLILVVLVVRILPFFLDLRTAQHAIQQPIFVLTKRIFLNRADRQAKAKQCPLGSSRLLLRSETFPNHDDVSPDDGLPNLLNQVL